MPERGYHLELITPVPLPRKPSGDLARLPLRVRTAVRQTRAVLDDVDADVVIGFGGYVALPAYLAARGGRAPPPGAGRDPRGQRQRGLGQPGRRPLGAAGAVRGARLRACGDVEVVGVPVRAAITSLDRAALRAEARAHFGFADDARVLLVFGGSQGAQSLNRAVVGGRRRPCRGRYFGAARARPEEHPRPPRARPTAIRRTSRCPIWTGWTSPTPPPTWRSAGPGR